MTTTHDLKRISQLQEIQESVMFMADNCTDEKTKGELEALLEKVKQFITER